MNAPLTQSPLAQPPLSQSKAATDDLSRMAGQIAQLEEITHNWDEIQIGTVSAIKTAIEQLNCEAFRRLIHFLREDPACAARLGAAVRDPFIFGVLRFHGLLKDPLEHRVERALEEVRPMLAAHGGNVELVAVLADDATVEVRLLGSCHGCPASSQTLTEGVEKAIRNLCPEIQHIRQVSHAPRQAQQAQAGDTHVVHFVSPFARAKDAGWEMICTLDEIPDGDILARSHNGHELLLYRRGSMVNCMNNACAHMGMPLDSGEVHDGTLKCSHHGFTYLLETGECLTVPEVQLTVHAVKVVNNEVSVRLNK